MRDILPSDVLPIIISYLTEIGQKKIAKKLRKKSELQDYEPNKLNQTSLEEIMKFYIKSHKKIFRLFKEPKSKKQLDDEPSVDDYIAQKLATLANGKEKKRKRKRNHSQVKNELSEQEEIQDDEQLLKKRKSSNELEAEQVLPKKQRKQSLDKKEASRKSSSSEVIDEPKAKVASRKSSLNGLKDETYKFKSQTQKNLLQQLTEEDQKDRINFQKVDYSRMKTLDEKLKDNSFEAKFKFGAGDAFGAIGHEKLIVTRGQGFKKEKQKLKAKMFTGENLINIHQINSIKLS